MLKVRNIPYEIIWKNSNCGVQDDVLLEADACDVTGVAL